MSSKATGGRKGTGVVVVVVVLVNLVALVGVINNFVDVANVEIKSRLHCIVVFMSCILKNEYILYRL